MIKPSKFYGQWAPFNVDYVLYENFFKDHNNGGILIESGCSDGLTEVNGKIFEENGWLCINIEPEPDRYNQLIKNRLFNKNNINLDCVLSDTDYQIVEFDVGPRKGNIRQGKTLTYKTMISKIEPIIETIDLFILDVEGHELKVIEGMKESKIIPEIMCVEYTWIGLENLDKALSQFNYKRLFLSYNNAFYSLKDYKGPFFGETKHWSELGINC